MEERYNLAIDRMKAIIEEKTVAEPYREYFQHVARFMLKLDELKQNVESGKQKEMSEEELQEEMKDLYADELEANYEKSYANPAYAVLVLGGELGSFLSAVYTEIRGSISYVQEQRMEYVVIGAELLIEIYNKFEEEKQPQLESLKEIFYWYASDYCDVFAADRIKDQIDPERGCFIVNMIMNEDLSDLRYLYRMGEYVGVNERETAAYLNSLSQEKIDKMADTFSEGYRIGFVNTGKDLSKKSVVNIYYAMGFERIVKKAIENFAKMGLKPSIFRTSHSVITRGRNSQIGFFNISGNKQYVYDHRDDIGLVMDKQYVERKLEVMRTTYEQNKEIAAGYAGQSFNLSHSGKYVLCSAGVSGERVGCDIECMRKYHERLAEKYFCSSEYERIRNADEAERTEMFYRYWVLKESFLKATRKGLVMGLNTSEIQIPKQGDPFFLRQPEEIREAYYLKEYQTDGARIAVCSTNPNFDENILDMTDIYKREMIVELKD